jgi:hypothetical protein
LAKLFIAPMTRCRHKNREQTTDESAKIHDLSSTRGMTGTSEIANDRAALIRQAFRLEYITLAWMMIEATVAIGSGISCPLDRPTLRSSARRFAVLESIYYRIDANADPSRF